MLLKQEFFSWDLLIDQDRCDPILLNKIELNIDMKAAV